MSEFAGRFGTSPSRKQLIQNLIEYRKLLAGAGYERGFQFVDGSFVEDVEKIKGRDPSDVDIFSFLDVPAKYLHDRDAWNAAGFPFWRDEIINCDLNKKRFSLDTYGVLIQGMMPLTLIGHAIYWYGLFSHQRETFAWKGFVAIQLDPAGDEMARKILGVE